MPLIFNLENYSGARQVGEHVVDEIMGETLSHELGVSSTYFEPVSSRPVNCGAFGFHLDYFRRAKDDIEIPGFAESARLRTMEEDHDEHEEEEMVRVDLGQKCVDLDVFGEEAFVPPSVQGDLGSFWKGVFQQNRPRADTYILVRRGDHHVERRFRGEVLYSV